MTCSNKIPPPLECTSFNTLDNIHFEAARRIVKQKEEILIERIRALINPHFDKEEAIQDGTINRFFTCTSEDGNEIFFYDDGIRKTRIVTFVRPSLNFNQFQLKDELTIKTTIEYF